mmetsp:Transcript_21145/g.67569  ORF Transcript_21145/g.67569 Transcript_21145/m.67569 type:complete len:277 (-) Transcript_21145:791-1621(-)
MARPPDAARGARGGGGGRGEEGRPGREGVAPQRLLGGDSHGRSCAPDLLWHDGGGLPAAAARRLRLPGEHPPLCRRVRARRGGRRGVLRRRHRLRKWLPLRRSPLLRPCMCPRQGRQGGRTGVHSRGSTGTAARASPSPGSRRGAGRCGAAADGDRRLGAALPSLPGRRAAAAPPLAASYAAEPAAPLPVLLQPRAGGRPCGGLGGGRSHRAARLRAQRRRLLLRGRAGGGDGRAGWRPRARAGASLHGAGGRTTALRGLVERHLPRGLLALRRRE